MGKFMAFVNYVLNLDLCTSLQMVDRHLNCGDTFSSAHPTCISSSVTRIEAFLVW